MTRRIAHLSALAFLCILLAPSQHAAVQIEIGQNFGGTTFAETGLRPPDCNGAVGPNEFVELINGRFCVYAKTNGSRLQAKTDQEFWTDAGVAFDTRISDPRIVYDPTVQRWFALAIDVPASFSSNHFLVAVSAGADPTGTWKGASFIADPTDGHFADFPTMGVDSNGVYLAAVMFNKNTLIDFGNTLVSVPKADLLADPPIFTNRTELGIFDSDDFGFVFQPAVTFDSPFAVARLLAVGHPGTDFLSHSNLVSLTIEGAATTNVTVVGPTNILVEGYNVPINPTQPNGYDNLDDGDNRFSATVQQVNGILYAAHGCQVSNRAAIRWYKINATNDAVIQSGTIFHPDLDLFYPSIAANLEGTTVLCFNGCSTNTFVSIYAVAGETVDGVTTFGGLQLLKSGLASYVHPVQSGISRWGDYTATCVDPTDSSRFWTIQMYPIAVQNWGTQITELKTRIIPQLAINRAATNVLLSWRITPGNYQLEFAANFSASNFWSPVLDAPVTNGTEISLQLPAAAEAQFFRLKAVP